MNADGAAFPEETEDGGNGKPGAPGGEDDEGGAMGLVASSKSYAVLSVASTVFVAAMIFV